MNAQTPAPTADTIETLEPFLIYNWNKAAQAFEPIKGYHFPPFKPQATAYFNLSVKHPKRETDRIISEALEFINETLTFYHSRDLQHLDLERMHPRDRVQLFVNVQALNCAVMVWCDDDDRQRWVQSARRILGIQ